MATENGNGKTMQALALLSAIGAVAAFIVGLVLGQQNAMAAVAEKYVPRAQYDKDQTRLESELSKLNEKLDEILRRQR